MKVQEYWIGSIHFSEAFGDDTVQRLNALSPIRANNGQCYKICAEHLSIGEIPIHAPTKYRVLIDRMSYLYPPIKGTLMGYAFRGVYTINNPFSFYYYLNNKDAAYMVARELGINVPKTYSLPSKESPGLRQADFKYHRYINWQAIVEDLGFPIVIKPVAGRRAVGFNIAHNLDELTYYYDQSGSQAMLLQNYVPTPYNWQIRVLCIGRKIIPIKYIFRKDDASEYLFEPEFLDSTIGQRVIDTCKIINRALGYEMNAIELLIDESGTLQAIDFNNPVPDGRLIALGNIFYEDYQQAMCQLVVDIVKEQRSFEFIPTNINQFATLARCQNLGKQEKFSLALKLANRYYFTTREPKKNRQEKRWFPLPFLK